MNGAGNLVRVNMYVDVMWIFEVAAFGTYPTHVHRSRMQYLSE